jgi:hypothetical protein
MKSAQPKIQKVEIHCSRESVIELEREFQRIEG